MKFLVLTICHFDKVEKSTYTFYFLPAIDKELRLFCSLRSELKEKDYLRYLYVINLLLYYRAHYGDLYDAAGITINRNQLAEIAGVSKGKASQLLKNLCAWQVIDKTRGFREGQYSKAFRLNIRLEKLRVSFKIVKDTDAIFIRKLIKWEHEKVNGSKLLREQMDILKKHIKVNDQGLAYLNEKYRNAFLLKLLALYREEDHSAEMNFSELFQNIKIDSTDLGLLSFIIGRIFVERPDKLSRIYTNLSCLKRSHRRFISFEGRPLFMTDLINSQIVFSVVVIGKHLKMMSGRNLHHCTPDFEEYKHLAISGMFYEELAKAAQWVLTPANRTEFKKAFFKEVFFSRPMSRGQNKEAFKKRFPNVLKAINQIKKVNHADFAIRLQRMEAGIIIDNVLKELLTLGLKALTIHDSVVVNNLADLDQVEPLIKGHMIKKYDLAPSFKRELPPK